MKSKQVEKPDQARKLNGVQLVEMAKGYALVELGQARCSCETCGKSADDTHFFAAALGIVGAAAIEDRAGSLYDVLTKWAQENLSDFPPGLRGSLYQARETDFPELIHEEDDEN